MDELLLEVPQALGERNVVDMRIDKAADTGVEAAGVLVAELPHLVDGWKRVYELALFEHLYEQRFNLGNVAPLDASEFVGIGWMVKQDVAPGSRVLFRKCNKIRRRIPAQVIDAPRLLVARIRRLVR